MRFGVDRASVDPELAGLGLAQEALVAALGAHLPVELVAFGGRQGVGVSDRVLDLGEQLLADLLIALGLLGVVADHESVAHRAVVDDHLLDAQVAGDGVVAALAGERGVGFLVVATELLAEDVVPARPLQVAAVLRRLEPAVSDPHHPR